MSRPIIVVHNSKSGSSLPPAELRKLFEQVGFDVRKIIAVSTDLARDLSPYITKTLWIAAVGGDGTVSAVAQHVAGTKAVLVPLPGGTLNNFTKDLGIDQNIQQAIANAANGATMKIDVASVNGKYFVNNSSLGLYPRSLVERQQSGVKYAKWAVALYATVKAFVRFRVYRVTIDDRQILTPFVFVGNNDYQLESAGLSNRTRLTGGKLSIYAVNSDRRWSLVRLFIRSLFGRLSADRELIAYTSKTLTIDSNRSRLHLSRDGELDVCRPPLRYEIHTQALTIVR